MNKHQIQNQMHNSNGRMGGFNLLTSGWKLNLLNFILDETFSPVARARLLSKGLNINNRLEKGSTVTGDQACLACGNCVDACPVVSENQRFVFIQNLRTSMSLENFVGEACRRCYRCVNACPQVDKELKEYASAYRRGEKIIHFLFAAGMLLLAASGITMSHYKGVIPAADFSILGWAHKITGTLLLGMPLLYLFMDKRHFMKVVRRIFLWRKKDAEWIKELFKHIMNHKENRMPLKVQFNAGQKLWYLYLLFIIIPVMGTTGILQWLDPGNGTVANPVFSSAVMVHLIFAFVTDCLILVHFYLKYLRKWMIIIFEMSISLKRDGHLIYPAMYKNKTIDISFRKNQI